MREKKRAFLKFATGFYGERFNTFEELKEFIYEDILKLDGYENTLDLVFEMVEDYLRYDDEDLDEDDEY